VQELTGVVIRITELATQSANGTYSKFQRKALDAEAQALSREFLRISKSTAFNGTKLFDGSLGTGLRLQLGYGVDGSINAGVGGAIGTGRFAARSTVATGGSPQSVTLGDLNGDGVLDMVTADGAFGANTASIMLGNGDGTFKARTTVQTGANPRSVTLGDLNGDGVLDMITADTGGSTASIMLGNGDGTFKARTTVQTGAFPYSVTLGDLNGDGVLDIVTAGGTTASIMLGNGEGTFKAPTTASTGLSSVSATLGDLNGDGVLDIITADAGDSTASIFLSQTQSGLGSLECHLPISLLRW
jgi:flagellin-like hook-associated protein FlgL